MDGQMSIFDFLPPPSELDTLPEDEMAQEVGRRLGIEFKRISAETKWDAGHEYRCKVGKLVMNVCYETYMTMDERDGQRFIGADYSFETDGGGSPCDSVEEAVKFFEKAIKQYTKGDRGHGRTAKHI